MKDKLKKVLNQLQKNNRELFNALEFAMQQVQVDFYLIGASARALCPKELESTFN